MGARITTLEKTKERKRPTLLIFAGPNGSGKSTVTRCVKIQGLYINADEIKQTESLSDLEAAVEAETLREYCLRERLSFTFETVLSTSRNLDLIARAKADGYFVDCYFVLTSDPELNVFRVNSRVQHGGHDVPPDKIRSRYKKSLENIPLLIDLCDQIRIVDNTKQPFIIFLKDYDNRKVISPNSFWIEEQIAALTNS
jgi:predicted ABC-type ATPase